MTTIELLRSKKAEIDRVLRGTGAINVRLIGESVEIDAADEAEIDLVADFPGAADIDLSELAPAMNDLEALLGRTVYLFTERNLKEEVRAKLLAAALPL